MKQKSILMILTVFLIILFAGGALVYNFILGDTKPPSEAIQAVPLEITPSAENISSIQVDATKEATSTVTSPTSTAPAGDDTSENAAAKSLPLNSSTSQLFEISQDESLVSFNIHETLNGAPKDVIGTTNQVAGEVLIDTNDLSQVQLGTITINARTLETDSGNRNRAIRNFILNTDTYELITFKPTHITGLSGSAEVSKNYTFQIQGDLTIRDVTQSVIFIATVTAESETRISGSASTVVSRADYKLTIPSVPQVADVKDEVTLQIDFVLKVK
jgi:polyisoprenoid-binding protein YceI